MFEAIERLKYRIVCEALELLEKNLKIPNMDEIQRQKILYSCADIEKRIENIRRKYKARIEKAK